MKRKSLAELHAMLPYYTCGSIDDAIGVVDNSSLDTGESETVVAALEALRTDNATLREVAEGSIEIADALTEQIEQQRVVVLHESTGHCAVHGGDLTIVVEWGAGDAPEITVEPCSRCLEEKYDSGRADERNREDFA